MRTVFLVALLLIASGSHAAPAPVYRPSKAPKTPYEVMLAGLRKTGRATGPIPKSGGTWTLTAAKVEGHCVEKVVLTFRGSDGKVNSTANANSGAWIRVEGDKEGVFVLFLCGFTMKSGTLELEAAYKHVELAHEP